MLFGQAPTPAPAEPVVEWYEVNLPGVGTIPVDRLYLCLAIVAILAIIGIWYVMIRKKDDAEAPPQP